MLTIQLYFKEFKVKFKTALNSLSFWNEHPNNIHTSIETIHLPTFHFYSQCICQGSWIHGFVTTVLKTTDRFSIFETTRPEAIEHESGVLGFGIPHGGSAANRNSGECV